MIELIKEIGQVIGIIVLGIMTISVILGILLTIREWFRSGTPECETCYYKNRLLKKEDDNFNNMWNKYD